MNDEIKLPPLPRWVSNLSPGSEYSVQEYARLAVEQDRARRERREPYKHKLELFADGSVANFESAKPHPFHIITLCWTHEHVWIESARNRELARKLRELYGALSTASVAADALDGGER